MDMKTIDIKDGVTLHLLKDNKFKTNLITISLITKLDRENITQNSLIPLVLRRGNTNLPTMKEVSKKLDDMYGATLDASSEKIGDNLVIQFSIDSISNEYALEERDLVTESIRMLNDFLFNPVLEDGHFKEEYVVQEKETLKELINSKINDKASYSLDRAIEEMYKDEPYGLYKYGYVEDLEKIDATSLYNQYLNLLKTSKIEIYVSGTFEENKIIDEYNKVFGTLDRTYSSNSYISIEKGKIINSENIESKDVVEHQDVIQGKFILGYRLKNVDLVKDYYSMLLYSAILGGTASSKLFMNVREKLSLAYTIRDVYLKHKGAVIVSAGIENDNFDICKEATLKEIEDMKIGNISKEEIDSAKANLVTRYKSLRDSQGAMIGLIIGQELLNSDIDIDDIISNINKITIDDIKEVASRLELQITYFLTK